VQGRGRGPGAAWRVGLLSKETNYDYINRGAGRRAERPGAATSRPALRLRRDELSRSCRKRTRPKRTTSGRPKTSGGLKLSPGATPEACRLFAVMWGVAAKPPACGNRRGGQCVIIEAMGAHSSEEETAIALAAAVEKWAAEGTASTPLPQAIEVGLDGLLYGVGNGGDGIRELSVSQSGPTCITIVGLVIWLGPPTLGPFEAKFHLDKAGAVKALTLRAGDGRISERDAPQDVSSWRTQLRMIESRPNADEDWAHVLHYEFD
jgi:hypothetical protein